MQVHVGVSKAEAQKFSQAVVAAHSIVGKKLGNGSTAKRQSPEVQALMAVMRLTKQQHLDSDLIPSSPLLQRTYSLPLVWR